MYIIYNWITWLYNRIKHNLVNQLYFIFKKWGSLSWLWTPFPCNPTKSCVTILTLILYSKVLITHRIWRSPIFFFLLRLHLQHMEIPIQAVEFELQLLAYTTSTAMPDPSHVFDLHHSSWQCWILNPLNKSRDRTCICMHTSWVYYHWATKGNLKIPYFKRLI